MAFTPDTKGGGYHSAPLLSKYDQSWLDATLCTAALNGHLFRLDRKGTKNSLSPRVQSEGHAAHDELDARNELPGPFGLSGGSARPTTHIRLTTSFCSKNCPNRASCDASVVPSPRNLRSYGSLPVVTTFAPTRIHALKCHLMRPTLGVAMTSV
jgi:hypothetical protein